VNDIKIGDYVWARWQDGSIQRGYLVERHGDGMPCACTFRTERGGLIGGTVHEMRPMRDDGESVGQDG